MVGVYGSWRGLVSVGGPVRRSARGEVALFDEACCWVSVVARAGDGARGGCVGGECPHLLDELRPRHYRAGEPDWQRRKSQLHCRGGPSTFPVGLAVDGAHIYWANGGTRAIGRANLDGSGVNPSFITSAGGSGMAVNSAHIYWTSGDSIGRANLDGSGVNPSFIKIGRAHV